MLFGVTAPLVLLLAVFGGVFQRFFRAQGDRSRESGGAGLGLALCQSIAQAHGGEIKLESEPGRDTRVTVRLPRVATNRSSMLTPEPADVM